MIVKASPIRFVITGLVLLIVLGGYGLRFADIPFFDGSGKKGGDSESLFMPSEFSGALDAVRGEIGPDGGVLELRIEPDEARFQVQTGADSAKGFLWDGGDLDSFRVQLVGSGSLEGQAINLADIDPGTPERVAKAVAERWGGDLDDVTALKLDRDIVSGEPQWNIWIASAGNNPRLYLADLDGSGVRSPGERR